VAKEGRFLFPWRNDFPSTEEKAERKENARLKPLKKGGQKNLQGGKITKEE